MTEPHQNDRRDEQKTISDENKNDQLEDNSDIIELSDIAIGTTPEDDVIVELTEEVIDEAMVGISGATRDTFKEGEEYLDLTKVEPEKEVQFKGAEIAAGDKLKSDDFVDASGSTDLEAEDVEDHISKELDDFFSPEEETVFVEKPVSLAAAKTQPEKKSDDAFISQTNLVEVVEAVIKKIYGDRINTLIADVIEKIVREEITRIKETLIGKTHR
jgi:hypothetical protein